MLADGQHEGRQLIPCEWMQAMKKPSAAAPFYGWLVWLNPQGLSLPGASAQSCFMLGAGGHCVWVEPELDAVVVVRWLDGSGLAGFMQRARSALIAGLP